MKKPTIAVGYVRMSTDRQETSPEQQRQEILKYAAAHGYSVAQWYEDLGISGDRTEKRTSFQKMIADAADGRFKAIICWDQDRFGRFDSLESGYWIFPLRKQGVRLVTVTDGPIDWESFAGRMLYGMKQEGKHQYLVDLSNNVTRKMSQMATSGQWVAGTPPFGYRVGANRKLELDEPAKVDAVRYVFEQYIAGKSTRQLAAELRRRGIIAGRGKPFSPTGVSEMMKNPVYCGTFRWGFRNSGKYQRRADEPNRRSADDRIEIEDAHPAIVTKELQQRCIAELSNRKRVCAPTTGGAFALTGLLRCGHCGFGMHADNANRTLSYLCYSYRQRPGTCERHSINQAEAIERILTELKDKLFEASIVKRLRDEMIRQLTTSNTSTDTMQDQVDVLDRKISSAESRLLEVSRDMIPRVEAQIRELTKQRQSLSEAISRTSAQMLTSKDANARVDRALQWFRNLEQIATSDFDPQAMRTMIAEFIEKVELKFERVQWGPIRQAV